MSEFRSLLTRHLQGVCELADRQVECLEDHYRLLLLWNRRINLTSVRRVEDIVVRHYCESLALGANLPANPLSIADIGSGAGFPGFPVAVMRPDCEVTLVESHARKSVFLREASREIPNIHIAEQRAESLTSGFDWVISRAVGWKELLPLLPRLGNHAALLLGTSDAEELRHEHGIIWAPPMRLPWGQRRVVLLGDVPRGTST